MIICHVTDLHFNQHAHHWIEQHHQKADVLCVTGDFLDTRVQATVSISEQIDFYQQWFTSFNKPIWLCSGNHDLDSTNKAQWLAQQYFGEFIRSDGAIWHHQNKCIASMGYHESDYSLYHDVDILLHHVPPARCSVARHLGVDYGDPALRVALKHQIIKPGYILTGHVHLPDKHKCRLGNTIVVNAGGIHNKNMASHAFIEIG